MTKFLRAGSVVLAVFFILLVVSRRVPERRSEQSQNSISPDQLQEEQGSKHAEPASWMLSQHPEELKASNGIREDARSLPENEAALGPLNGETNALEAIVQVLFGSSDEPDADSRKFAAAQKLRELGPDAALELDRFREALLSGDEKLAFSGARALAFTAEHSPLAWGELTNALIHSNPKTRMAATHGVGVLFDYQPERLDYSSTVPTLLNNLRDESQSLRADTVNTLWQYIDSEQRAGRNGDVEVILPDLVERLTDDYRYVRLNALLAIKQYGTDANIAAPHVAVLLNDADERVRSQARMALNAIAHKE